MSFGKRHVLQAGVHTAEPSKRWVIGTQNNFICSRKFDAHTVICEASVLVKVKDKHMAVPFEADDFVAFVRPRNVSRIAVQPSVLLLRKIHGSIEFIQKLVFQGVVV